MKNLFFSPRLQLAFAFLILVFVVDIVTPIGLGVNMLYLFCFFLILEENRSYILGFGVLIIGALLVHMVMNYNKIWNWMILLDEWISIFVILLTMYVNLKYRGLQKKANKEREAYVKSLEEMLFITSHKIRKPVASCLGLIQITQFEALKKDELQFVFNHLKSNADELNGFTKELTDFMSELKLRMDASDRKI